MTTIWYYRGDIPGVLRTPLGDLPIYCPPLDGNKEDSLTIIQDLSVSLLAVSLQMFIPTCIVGFRKGLGTLLLISF